MLKLKCEERRKRKVPQEFPVNLRSFENKQKRIQRLRRKPNESQRNAFAMRDAQIRDNEEEKKSINDEDD